MMIHRSRAGSRQPRPPARRIREVIEHHCTTCDKTYELHRNRTRLMPGMFYVTQGHLQVICPEGHPETIETTERHLM